MSSIQSLSAWRFLVGADLNIFFRDKRSLILNLATPLVIAGLFGMVFGGGETAPGRMSIAVVDQDASEASKAIVAGIAAEKTLEVLSLDREAAREEVRKGKVHAAILLPAGFGDAAGKAFLGGGAKPPVTVLYDPSQTVTIPMVQGLLTQQVFAAVTGNLFSGASGVALIDESLATLDAQGLDAVTTGDLRELLMRVRILNQRNRAELGGMAEPEAGGPSPLRGGLTVPFELADEAVTSGRAPYNGYAHACAGMGVQFILMMGIESGVGLLLLRRRGLWLGCDPEPRDVHVSIFRCGDTVRRARRRKHAGLRGHCHGVRAYDGCIWSADCRARPDAGGHAWSGNFRDAGDGSTGWRLGAVVHVPGMAADCGRGVAHTLGHPRARGHDLARPGPGPGATCHRRLAGTHRRFPGDCDLAFPLGPPPESVMSPDEVNE